MSCDEEECLTRPPLPQKNKLKKSAGVSSPKKLVNPPIVPRLKIDTANRTLPATIIASLSSSHYLDSRDLERNSQEIAGIGPKCDYCCSDSLSSLKGDEDKCSGTNVSEDYLLPFDENRLAGLRYLCLNGAGRVEGESFTESYGADEVTSKVALSRSITYETYVKKDSYSKIKQQNQLRKTASSPFIRFYPQNRKKKLQKKLDFNSNVYIPNILSVNETIMFRNANVAAERRLCSQPVGKLSSDAATPCTEPTVRHRIVQKSSGTTYEFDERISREIMRQSNKAQSKQPLASSREKTRVNIPVTTIGEMDSVDISMPAKISKLLIRTAHAQPLARQNAIRSRIMEDSSSPPPLPPKTLHR